MLLFLQLTSLLLVGNVTSQENIVIQTSIEIIIPRNRSSRVLDELPLGHLVLDVGGGQVDGEEDQGEAEHVDRVHCHTKSRVALTKSDGKLLKKSLQVGAPFIWGLKFGKESSESIGKECVGVILERDKMFHYILPGL